MSEFHWTFDDNGTSHLEHHGIKGQKWGVITKAYEPVGPRPRTNTYSSLGPKPRTNTYSSLGPKPWKRPSKEERKEINRNRAENGRKWLIGLGLIVAGAAGYAMYKTGKIKKDESEWAKRYREKSIYKYKPYSESSARMKEVAKRFEERAKKYTELANKASRRIAVKNWMKNKGRIRIKEVS